MHILKHQKCIWLKISRQISHWVCLCKGGKEVRAKEASPACNRISNQFKVLFWELWPQARPAFVNRSCRHWLILQSKARPRLTKDLIKFSIFKKQLLFFIVMSYLPPAWSQMFPFFNSKPQSSSQMHQASSIPVLDPVAGKLTERNTFVYAPSHTFSLSGFQ